jgi:xylan 1,4-beta-xylosidase
MTLLAASLLVNAPAIQVHWDQVIGRTTPLSYGLNLFRAHDPTEVASSTYQQALEKMASGWVRLHSWESMGDATAPQGWIDTANRRWAMSKIVESLDALGAKTKVVLANLPSWPEWMDRDGDGLPDQKGDFARWCADFVRGEKSSKIPIDYLEITNEKDMPLYADYRSDGGRRPLKIQSSRIA